ncbi:hypothetical protein H5410_051964 [Solanum commersonii]|uniref:Uncharacterized protein n=1 Tax=Solanum commersonii TaxID=4109 RepID=A0A9J5WZL0_SOLCO|nr:hypothetical protein H5410_051964 [Solanum commersonii]
MMHNLSYNQLGELLKWTKILTSLAILKYILITYTISEPKLNGFVEPIDKSLAFTLNKEGEGLAPPLHESMLLASAELLDKSLAPTLINGIEGKIKTKLQGSIEHVDEVLAPTLIRGGDAVFDSKLLGYVELIHKALAPPKIICSKEESPIDVDQESEKPSNAKDEPRETRKIKKRQSNSTKDLPREIKKKKTEPI